MERIVCKDKQRSERQINKWINVQTWNIRVNENDASRSADTCAPNKCKPMKTTRIDNISSAQVDHISDLCSTIHHILITSKPYTKSYTTKYAYGKHMLSSVWQIIFVPSILITVERWYMASEQWSKLLHIFYIYGRIHILIFLALRMISSPRIAHLLIS